MTGQDYDDFVDSFVQAVKEEFPNVLLQWEDFATPHAPPILERYRDELLTFNDDIQGTAAVALGAILGAVGVTGRRLRDQRIVILGAGSAAVGVAELPASALMQDGLSEAEAQPPVLAGRQGRPAARRAHGPAARPARSTPSPTDGVADWPRAASGNIGLARRSAQVEPTILIGLSTGRRRLHRADRPRDGRARRAADHLPALEPDEPRRGHAATT